MLYDHVMMVSNAKALSEIFTRSCYSGNPRPDLAVPVLLTQLLNLRKLDITVGVSPYLMAIVTRIVSGTSHIHEKSLSSCCFPPILRGEQQCFMISEEGVSKGRTKGETNQKALSKEKTKNIYESDAMRRPRQ